MAGFELIAPCHFGMEAVLKRELEKLGFVITGTQDGKVCFEADAEGILKANIHLRTPERILIKIGQFRAESFEELFENTKALPFEDIIPEDGKFWVAKATSVSSALFSPSDIQSIIKKAIVERLKTRYHREWFDETGSEYPFRVSIIKDIVTIGLDTTGVSLHKRGYRVNTVKAPLTETLAAPIIMLTPWKGDRILVDPFCGSGTFPIEAALMAAGIAPGLDRSFICDTWTRMINGEASKRLREEARDSVKLDIKTDIQGYDIDGEAVENARLNARRAGVEHLIHFQKRPVSGLSHSGSFGFIITNPPYGERIGEAEELPEIYAALGERFRKLDRWSMYMLTAYEDAVKYTGGTPDKNRKLYNGKLKTYLYQYIGPKPPKRQKRDNE